MNWVEVIFLKIVKQIIFVLVLLYFSALNFYHQLFNFFNKKDYFNRKHLEVHVEGLSIRFRWFSHVDYINYQINKLNKFRQENNNAEEFLDFLFKECKKCNMVFLHGRNDKKLLCFWFGDGNLMVNFPIIKNNGMKRYKYQMLGVLNELGIHQLSDGLRAPKRLPYYQVYKYSDQENYEIYFQNYSQDAVKFVKLMFEEVFKESLDDLGYILS